jgi:hypothetical protein
MFDDWRGSYLTSVHRWTWSYNFIVGVRLVIKIVEARELLEYTLNDGFFASDLPCLVTMFLLSEP